MSEAILSRPKRLFLCLAAACLLGAEPEQLLPGTIDFSRPSTLLPPIDFSVRTEMPMGSTRDPRIPLFRMPTGMVGVNADDETVADAADAVDQLSDSAFGVDNRLRLDFGKDNPYFDFRHHGTAGGLGYYRLEGQYQLLEVGRTGIAFAFRGITPAGLDCDGVENGPTLFVPALAWYHWLDNGSALEGFVGKSMHAGFRAGMEGMGGSLQYGLTYQKPLWCASDDSIGSVHMFVEALGYYRCDQQFGPAPPPSLELLPGLHFRAGDNWWLSGGVVLPLGTPRAESGLWQITCWWRF
jgi:hypothetical protein